MIRVNFRRFNCSWLLRWLVALINACLHQRMIDARQSALRFEKARYGNQALTPAQLAQMGAIYRRLYRQADVLNSLNVPLGKRSMSGG
ncbi:MAG: hypothetical protein KAX90_02680 [Pseudomonas sp.]|nr:hypothetical protein [Pseudomonas sp.]